MADYKSDQYTNATAFPMTPTKSYEKGTKVTVLFTYTVPVGGITTTDRVALCVVPKWAVLLGGKIAQDALGNSIVIGDGTTANKFLASTSVASAGASAFNDTLALYYMERQSAELIIWATPAVGAWTAGKLLYGEINYMIGG